MLNQIAYVLSTLLVFVACAGAQSWNLAWSDEFNGAANTPIDPTKWTYDTGNLGVNNELEWYCAQGSSVSPCDPNNPNAYIDGTGNLVIRAIRITSGTAPGSNAWTSARLTTANNLVNFKYGRIESSIKLPIGPGIWPAFWALGSDIGTVGWPAAGEIDFMENVPAASGLGPSVISSTLHGPGYSGTNGLSKKYNFPTGMQVDTRFHTYGAIWSPYMIQFYVDDPASVFFVRTASDTPAGTTWPYNNNFFLLLNLAVGGTGSWPGPPDSTTPNPALMLVDYVRAYQPAPINGPSMSAPAIAVKAGANGTSTISLSSLSGTGRVYLACSGAPAKSTCSVNTSDALDSYVVDFSNSANATATLNIATTGNSSERALVSTGSGFLLLFVGIVGITFTGFSLRGSGIGKAGLAMTIAMFMGLSCGGGSNTPIITPPGNGTPPGNYVLTVTAYTVSGGTSTVTVPLTVN